VNFPHIERLRLQTHGKVREPTAIYREGTLPAPGHSLDDANKVTTMNNIIYLVGLVVVVGAILSFVFH
jgi:hypothetical protein